MKKKILIVDNDPLILEFISDLLTKENHDVIKAEDGISALNILTSFIPDIMFIDLIMPRISGEKLCHIVRDMHRLDNCYLVVISAAIAEQEIEYSEIGADAYITKAPYSIMKEHILSILDASDLPPSRTADKESRMIGMDNVYARQMTKELLSENRHLEVILESMSEGILEVDSGRIIYANSAATLLFGMNQQKLLGSYFTELFDKQEKKKVKALFRSGIKRSNEIGLNNPIKMNGNLITIKNLPMKKEESSTIIMLTDVTKQKRAEEEKRKLEAQLQRAQKMEAIGTLAGGVAHDLNNILAGLVTYPEFLLLDIPQDSPLRKSVLTIQKSGEKAAAIVKELLTLARRGVAVSEVVNLNNILSDYLKSLEHEKLKSYYPNIDFKVTLEKNLQNIVGSSVHLSKTIMNLVSNAVEAMPAGGIVTISTENHYLSKPIRGYDHIREGDYSVLKIADEGLGISAEDLERIFEPFYTKKVMGKSGTGLGMAVVWGTVKDHNGYIDVQSIEGTGTTFVLYFPATNKELSKNPSDTKIEDYCGDGQSILIIDDVEEQRMIATSILSKLNYRVASVSSGEEAVDYLRKNSVDLLIIDMIMDPGMDGLDTYKKILEIHPGQRAIIASGFAETDQVKETQKWGAGQYIKKPYKMDKLGLAVKAELAK